MRKEWIIAAVLMLIGGVMFRGDKSLNITGSMTAGAGVLVIGAAFFVILYAMISGSTDSDDGPRLPRKDRYV